MRVSIRPARMEINEARLTAFKRTCSIDLFRVRASGGNALADGLVASSCFSRSTSQPPLCRFRTRVFVERATSGSKIHHLQISLHSRGRDAP
jgi:hypothetical protein